MPWNRIPMAAGSSWIVTKTTTRWTKNAIPSDCHNSELRQANRKAMTTTANTATVYSETTSRCRPTCATRNIKIVATTHPKTINHSQIANGRCSLILIDSGSVARLPAFPGTVSSTRLDTTPASIPSFDFRRVELLRGWRTLIGRGGVDFSSRCSRFSGPSAEKMDGWRTLPRDFCFFGWPLLRGFRRGGVVDFSSFCSQTSARSAGNGSRKLVQKFPKMSAAADIPHFAFVSLEVPEGRHKVARRFNGGLGPSKIRSPGGAAQARACAAPPGLGFFPARIPTADAVGYLVSSLTGLSNCFDLDGTARFFPAGPMARRRLSVGPVAELPA